ncbi:acetyltransferase (GNAT) family domain-containing protein [Ditylenchus destructor]|uniref:Acetyltransferase (GNAT) family domain-containing protein n=1 Tax=Ditylenchus destructor TaxID=166010 RepID=A0AAD4N4C9_9BILA|nr:acetyltransferase (GNAT) family domain-containing protein [Ditylenchus destructor]
MVQNSRTKCPLKYCKQGRCSAQKYQNKNVDPKRDTSEQESKEQKSEQRYNRFTRVTRTYPWHEGRAAETRPAVFSQCIIKRCKKNIHCRQTKKRQKRTPNTCKFCSTILGQCSHYRYEHERWLPNIQLTRQGRHRYRLEIPHNDTENIAFLDYGLGRDNDENETPIVQLRFIETKKPFQNKGLGTALLKYFIEERVMKTKYRNTGKIKLYVMRGHQNVEAYGLYYKCGFVKEHPEEPGNHNMILILADYKPENCVSGKLDLV